MYDNSCIQTYRCLDGLHIPYTKLKDVTEDGISGKKTCEALGFSPSRVYKTILVLSDKKQHPSVAVLPANRKPDPEKISRAVGKSCHAAGDAFINDHCSEPKGLFGPFFPKTVSVYLDRSAEKADVIVVNAGGAGNYIALSVADFIKATDSRYAELSSGDSAELYGRNYALSIGAVIDGFRISAVRNITPLEIFYEAENLLTGQTVDICEYFPRFHGYYAVRGADGESVKWLRYTNDTKPRYTPDTYGGIKSMYRRGSDTDICEASPKIIKRAEQNDTFYTVYDHISGEPLTKFITETEKDSVNPEAIKTAIRPLSEILRAGIKPVGCIRPDTVYLDIAKKKAYLLTFCVPTGIFGKSSGIRFMYNADYDPFIVKDETALARVICLALLGKSRYFRCENSAEAVCLLKDEIPDSELAILSENLK